ncbi:unnamed protein product [Callosobruchus maculatus]|uniref:Uncharacterized protein n=1 Tax=Callosobruchus maculatus TaxID=64391 RepID=A0A653CSN1_CALMS|nr:unnamed protein product [Callosobruchus maculatus]
MYLKCGISTIPCYSTIRSCRIADLPFSTRHAKTVNIV